MVKVVLTQSQINFLEAHSTIVVDGENKYYHIPTWFKQTPQDEEDTYEILGFNDLSDEVKGFINTFRAETESPINKK